MNRSIVIDIGTARVKVAYHSNDVGEVSNYKIDTFLSKKVSPEKVIDEEYIAADFIPMLCKVINDAREHGCSRALIVGTYIFRDSINSDATIKAIKQSVGPLNVLSGGVEGALLYSHLTESFADEVVVCDIGGGSVQISTGGRPEDVSSIPTGTFTLEKKFQASANVATTQELDEMYVYIRGQLENIVVDIPPGYIVIGSNNMADFFAAIHSKASLVALGQANNGMLFYNVQSLRAILDLIKGTPYNELSSYFPANPTFMFGADKALANIICIAEKFGDDIPIVPTNESLSTSLLGLLSSGARTLSELGIEYFDLV